MSNNDSCLILLILPSLITEENCNYINNQTDQNQKMHDKQARKFEKKQHKPIKTIKKQQNLDQTTLLSSQLSLSLSHTCNLSRTLVFETQTLCLRILDPPYCLRLSISLSTSLWISQPLIYTSQVSTSSTS